MLRIYLAVGLGGMLGACLRFVIANFFENMSESVFPWATFFVNVTGAFVLTFLLFLPAIKKNLGEAVFVGLTTGLLGSYTTFSLIIVELDALFSHHKGLAALYLLTTIFIGLFTSYLGYALANRLSNKEAT